MASNYLTNTDKMELHLVPPQTPPKIVTLQVNGTPYIIYLIEPYDYIPGYYTILPDDPVVSNGTDVFNALDAFSNFTDWLVNEVPLRCSFDDRSKFNRGWRCCGFYAPMLYFVQAVKYDWNEPLNPDDVETYTKQIQIQIPWSQPYHNLRHSLRHNLRHNLHLYKVLRKRIHLTEAFGST